MMTCSGAGALVAGKPSFALVSSSEKWEDPWAAASCSSSFERRVQPQWRKSSPQLSKLRIVASKHFAVRERSIRPSNNERLFTASSHLARIFAMLCNWGSIAEAENGACGRRSAFRVRRKQLRPKAQDDDFEVDEDVDFGLDREGLDDDEEEDFRDYETEYESPVGYKPIQKETDSFISTEGEEEETVVGWKINEDEFHKFELLTCDFFIRKVPDPDNDVYDFREMYVTPTDTDIYSIPKVVGKMPKKPLRCSWSTYEYIHTTEPPVDVPRAPMSKTDMEVMKIFLTKHLKDRRAGHKKFVLDFEEIYVIDCKTKSFTRVDVKVDVPGGKTRDRTTEVLIVRDDGTTFRIIPEEEQKSPDEIVQAMHWETTREAMENHLRGFRDYEISNWF